MHVSKPLEDLKKATVEALLFHTPAEVDQVLIQILKVKGLIPGKVRR